jgi:hypothetical protein
LQLQSDGAVVGLVWSGPIKSLFVWILPFAFCFFLVSSSKKDSAPFSMTYTHGKSLGKGYFEV